MVLEFQEYFLAHEYKDYDAQSQFSLNYTSIQFRFFYLLIVNSAFASFVNTSVATWLLPRSATAAATFF